MNRERRYRHPYSRWLARMKLSGMLINCTHCARKAAKLLSSRAAFFGAGAKRFSTLRVGFLFILLFSFIVGRTTTVRIDRADRPCYQIFDTNKRAGTVSLVNAPHLCCRNNILRLFETLSPKGSSQYQTNPLRHIQNKLMAKTKRSPICSYTATK